LSQTPTIKIVCGGLTLDQREADLLAIVEDISDPVLLQQAGSPQDLAFTWLVEDDFTPDGDAVACPADVVQVQQRYILAVFYYSTDGDNWLRCSQDSALTECYACSIDRVPTDCVTADKQDELQALYLSYFSECDWFGSICNGDNVLIELGVGK
jgi:hypothetical protein